MATRKRKRVKGTYTDEMQKLFREFKAATEKERNGHVPTLDEVFDWAEKHKKWTPPRRSIRAQFKMEMARALRAERVIDPQGNLVRQNYAVKEFTDEGQPIVFWADLHAPPEHIHMSLQQRRSGLVNTGFQLFIDSRSYNDNNPYGAKIQLDFNISKDIEDRLQPKEYPDERPPDDQNGDHGQDHN